MDAGNGRVIGPGACANCGEKPGVRPRRLCHRCYDRPAVRARFPAMDPRDAGVMGGARNRAAAPATPCAHCGRNGSLRSFGLCRACYFDRGIRDQYRPAEPDYTRHGSGVASDFAGPRPLPAEPTEHPPGTPEKLGVLAERAAAGEHLFHAYDARERGTTCRGGGGRGGGRDHERRLYRHPRGDDH